MNRTILVTGGAGFIGSHLIDALICRGYSSIVAIDDLSLGKLSNLDAARNLCANLEFHKIDLASGNMTSAFGGGKRNFDMAFHLAVIPLPMSLLHPKEVVDRNIAMTTTVCELSRKGQIGRLVNFSSSEVYGTAKSVPMNETHPRAPSTPYAASKLASDAVVSSYIETFGINAVTLRPFNNYGPRQNDQSYAGVIPIVITRIIKQEPIVIFGDGLQTRDFLFVRDTVNAAIDVALMPGYKGEEVNVGSGREISVNELVNLMLEITAEKDFKIEHHPPRPGDIRRHLADITKIKQLIKFEPKVSIREGLEETIKWYKEKVMA